MSKALSVFIMDRILIVLFGASTTAKRVNPFSLVLLLSPSIQYILIALVILILLATFFPSCFRLHGVCKENPLAPVIGRLGLPLYRTSGDNSVLYDHDLER